MEFNTVTISDVTPSHWLGQSDATALTFGFPPKAEIGEAIFDEYTLGPPH